MSKILVVDDEEVQLKQLEWAAKGEGREILLADSAELALDLIINNDFSVVVTDLRLQTPEAGLEILKAVKSRDIYCQVILVTAYGTPQISVETMRLGAFDYLERGAPGTDHLAMVRTKISQALEFREAKLGGKLNR